MLDNTTTAPLTYTTEKAEDFQREVEEFRSEDRGKMVTAQMIFGFLLIFLVEWMSCLSVHDPRLSPGHLQPLGTGRPKSPIESTIDYPSPPGEL